MRRDDTTRLGRRVVMLVDNVVEGDSRVQKSARSAADAGWDVTLIGCAHVDAERHWRLGDAEVRVLPLTDSPAVVSNPPGVPGLRARLVARGGLPLRAARLARRPVEHAQVRYWRARLRDGAWRRLEPGLWDYERVAGPVVDALRPDLIHAHDFRMLGVAARAVDRARAAGRDVKLVWDAHEWLPGARPRRDNARWLPAHLGYVREYVGHADAVVTVSDTLADLLVRDHALPERPTVVLNAPVAATPDTEAPGLRERCGLRPDTPLLVYSGAMAVQRGLDTVVEALPLLPGVHLALVVADPNAAYVRQVVARAGRHGVGDRVHVLPYVPHRQLVAFLATADIGLIPLHHWPNHEIALITKFFEYAHARLPIVVSDVRTMAETVRATGQGEVFRARDAADLARAVRTVLADPARYRAAYEGPDSPLPGWTWEAQAERLDALYRRLLTPTR
ncbi:glycosyltransferase [Micromonospora sp. BL1]|uniref:glycosyltransferase family 4 protein n=1 Tax=Micromonospora sp. BL1 TaxID=2478709 RepID=UPI000EF56F8C|nr:glycosyltransferase family 4 protein [Micromonospora sp. BL1]RLQ05793.1 glycosyltransferase [Micromonospora sp. BL1]